MSIFQVFVAWLKKNREKTADEKGSSSTNLVKTTTSGPRLITLQTVKEKVNQLLKEFGVEAIEQSCKWFLLWNNRYTNVYFSLYPPLHPLFNKWAINY